MMEAEPGSGEGTFDVSGGSTGGLWEMFPIERDSVLGGLTMDSDVELYP
jgi:hypothetical protein